ncbi:hypothetical protein Tco_0382518 [Tanacetum coccineum]
MSSSLSVANLFSRIKVSYGITYKQGFAHMSLFLITLDWQRPVELEFFKSQSAAQLSDEHLVQLVCTSSSVLVLVLDSNCSEYVDQAAKSANGFALLAILSARISLTLQLKNCCQMSKHL